MPPVEPAAPQPWDKLPEESAKAFAAFRSYKEAGPKRSLRALTNGGRKGDGNGVGTTVGRWSSRYRWVERSAAWDGHVAKLEQAAIEKAAVERAALWQKRSADDLDRYFALSSRMEAAAGLGLSDPQDAAKVPDVPPHELAALGLAIQRAWQIKQDVYAKALPPAAPDQPAAPPAAGDPAAMQTSADPDLAAVMIRAALAEIGRREGRAIEPPDA